GSGSESARGSTPDEQLRRQCVAEPAALARRGNTLGTLWADLVSVSKATLMAECTAYCASVGHCAARSGDESACLTACSEIISRAQAQACEQPLLDALICMKAEYCRSGLPDVQARQEVPEHPCALQLRALPCDLEPHGSATSAFSAFAG